MEVQTAEYEAIEDMDIYFIPYLQSDLYQFNIRSHEFSLALSPTDITLGYGPHLVPLSKTLLFIQGGIINAEFIADSFFLDLTTNTFEEKACGPTNGGGACIRLLDAIYIFGGATRDIYGPSTQSQKYSISNDEWETISPLPVASYNNCCVFFNSNITISGQHLASLYTYSPSTDNYSCAVEINGAYKVLLSWKSAIFVITQTAIKVFERNEWKDYRKSTAEAYTIVYSYPVYREGFIYFIVPAQTILRLNVDTKELEVIHQG